MLNVFKSRALAPRGKSALAGWRAQLLRGRWHVQRLLVSGCILLAFLTPHIAAAADMSRFQRLVASLADSEAASRSRFARIALLEMAEIHLAEAGLARNQSPLESQPERLLGWALSVESYAGQILRLHEEVEQGAPVSLLPVPIADTGIIVGERSVIISHPRRDQQQALEQAILQAFCAQEDCLLLLAAEVDQVPEPIPETRSGRAPDWSFTASGPVCEQDGLRVRFPAAGSRAPGGLAQYRSLCRQLFAELQQLAAELRWQQHQGVVPDWSAITINAVPHRTEHSIRLNRSGDSLLLAVPLLHGTPGLLQRVLPWLRSLVAPGAPAEMLLDAGELGWLGSP